MHEEIERELAAMQVCVDVLEPLDEGGRRRAVMWLAGHLGVDLTEYDQVIAREALQAAINGV